MTIEQRFIACDGKEFKTEEECVGYETSINKLQDIIPILEQLKNICRNQVKCKNCIFYNNSDRDCMFTTGTYPKYWELERIGG